MSTAVLIILCIFSVSMVSVLLPHFGNIAKLKKDKEIEKLKYEKEIMLLKLESEKIQLKLLEEENKKLDRIIYEQKS
ncbi:MAG: hypothetical protein FWG77_05300 [Treponema sp.]|nr:hypothetical protein [Treponema sp.]